MGRFDFVLRQTEQGKLQKFRTRELTVAPLQILQSQMQFTVLPRKVTIGKRLAQCLHPALPSGVHKKALESYELVLKRVKSGGGLARDLFVYSAGLFPLMGHASTSVKPLLLSLYETYYLPLGRQLLPCLKGLLLATLPGLEEGSEYYDR